MKKYVLKYRATIIVGIVLFALLVFTMYQFYGGAKNAAERVMANDIDQVVKILEQIDATCEIVNIVRDDAAIDFLQVQAFAGSQIGALQLKYPEKWKGPYLQRNLMVQGIPYELIQTREGFYVIPGKGVRLSNGKIVGKDIIFTRETDVELYLNAIWGLEVDGEPLARKLNLKHILTKSFAPSTSSSIDAV